MAWSFRWQEGWSTVFFTTLSVTPLCLACGGDDAGAYLAHSGSHAMAVGAFKAVIPVDSCIQQVSGGKIPVPYLCSPEEPVAIRNVRISDERVLELVKPAKAPRELLYGDAAHPLFRLLHAIGPGTTSLTLDVEFDDGSVREASLDVTVAELGAVEARLNGTFCPERAPKLWPVLAGEALDVQLKLWPLGLADGEASSRSQLTGRNPRLLFDDTVLEDPRLVSETVVREASELPSEATRFLAQELNRFTIPKAKATGSLQLHSEVHESLETELRFYELDEVEGYRVDYAAPSAKNNPLGEVTTTDAQPPVLHGIQAGALGLFPYTPLAGGQALCARLAPELVTLTPEVCENPQDSGVTEVALHSNVFQPALSFRAVASGRCEISMTVPDTANTTLFQVDLDVEPAPEK